jgi:hypothetical protein
MEAPKNSSEALEEGDGFWEDEQTTTQQMREMEVQMAKERADMARQKTELQRLHDEIRHELDGRVLSMVSGEWSGAKANE